MKNIGLIFATVLVAFAANSNAISSSWGQVGNYDKVLFSERILDAKTASGIHKNIEFPKLGNSNTVKINAIHALDYAYNVTASWAVLIAGGPGYPYATLNFKSRPNTGLDYQLVIYGN